MPCPICTGALISKAAVSTAAALGTAKHLKNKKSKPKPTNKNHTNTKK